MSSKSKKAKKIKKLVRNTVLCIAVFMLIISLFLFMQAWEKNRGVFDGHKREDATVVYNGKEYELKDDIETFLVIGLDKFDDFEAAESYNNDKQADFLMLLVFDNSAKECTAIQINRDTMAEIYLLGVAGNQIGTATKQIALAHTYGNGKDVSCRNTAESVSKLLLDMRVNHYVSLTMDAVAIVNDYVGGVPVKILDDFSKIDKTLVKGKTVKLNGEQALKYVRSRYGLEDSSNINRMARQRQYIEALYKKMIKFTEKDEDFAADALLRISEHMVSDRSITQMQELADKFSEYEFTGIETIEGESVKGKQYMEFYPHEESIKNIVFKLFYEQRAE